MAGGVTSMDDFLQDFFPSVYKQKMHAHENNYCKYDNQGLAAFTSCVYIAALVASLMASPVTRKYGRRTSILCGGISFLIGSALNAAAANLEMLIMGCSPLFVRDGTNPPSRRPEHDVSSSNHFWDFTANMINYGTQKIKPWGWRLSLGLAAIPALLMTVGGIFLPETPNSLVERGANEKGRKLLEKIRGTNDVDAEFQDMVDASELANSIKHPFRNILEKRNRPELVMAIFMPMFQILTGINSILFYAPVLFQSMGFGRDASLYSSALTGGVLVFSTFISIATVDRLGRRPLLVSGGIQMITCQVIVAIILGIKFGENQELSKSYSTLVVIVICLFVLAFGWSWGPLGWTVPSEIFALEVRTVGQSITVAVNHLFTLIITQAFLSLLCSFKFGIFLFFAGWITIMTIFVFVFLPETKGIPIEEVTFLWRRHWFWKKVLPDTTDGRVKSSKELGDAVQLSQTPGTELLNSYMLTTAHDAA
ncbi:Sugar/inositol transporter [Sesbania bispinosa]|nr:Sugar/inositol transporter [Sesbania bispinosa]